MQQGLGLSERSWRRSKASGMWCCTARRFGQWYRLRPQVLTQGCTKKICSMAPDTKDPQYGRHFNVSWPRRGILRWPIKLLAQLCNPWSSSCFIFEGCLPVHTRHNIAWDSNLRAQTWTFKLQVTLCNFINVSVIISKLRLGDTKENRHVTKTKYIPSSLLGRCVGEEKRAWVRDDTGQSRDLRT